MSISIISSTKLDNVYNDDVLNNQAAVTLSTHNERADKYIRFYRSKFHLVSIPSGIIFSIIHLKFAIEYLGQCTIQPMINIYMIVHASVNLFLILLALVGVIDARYIYSRSEQDNNKIVARRLIFIVVIATLVLLLFSLAWLVAGSVWVFGAKSHGVQGSDATITTTYCQSDLYKAAFVLIIVNYIVHLLMILIFIVKSMYPKKEHIESPIVIPTDRMA